MEQIPERLDVVGTEGADAPPHAVSVRLSVLAMVDAAEAVHPHRVAIDDGRRRLSPFLLGVTVRRLARAILDRAPPGPVGVALHEGTMGFVAALAALASGRDCVMLDPALLPEAARGCASLVSDPGEVTLLPPGCVGIDVFLSCGAAYAEARPALPDVGANAVAIRFGSADGQAFTLQRLIDEAGGQEAAHPAASGLLSCPRCLGGALAALVGGGEVRIGAGGDCGRSTATGISERR